MSDERGFFSDEAKYLQLFIGFKDRRLGSLLS